MKHQAETQDEETMTNLLQQLQLAFQDPSLLLLKAWRTANGTIGLCRSEEHGYKLIGILVHGKVWHVQYRQDTEDEAEFGAEIIAAFAGAEEVYGS
jgi:hypothetical protein